MDEQETTAIPWEEIVGMLLRRWRAIAITLGCGVVVSAVYAFLQGPVYQTSARLMVTSERARITVSPDPKSGPTVDRVTEQDLNSEVALLRSPVLVREVLEPLRGRFEQPQEVRFASRLGALLEYPVRLPGILYRRLHNVAPLSPFEGWVQGVVDRVVVTPIKTSNLIEVSFAASDPAWAAEFVNQLATHHVARHARISQQSEALGFLESQRQLLADKMHHAQETLAAFYDREGVEAASEQRATLRTRVAALEASLANSETEIAEASARADYLTRDIHSAPGAAREPGPPNGDPLQVIRSRILQLQLQRSELLSKFAPTSLKVQEIDRQIHEAERLLEEEKKRSGGRGMNPTLELDLSRTQAQIAAVKARADALRGQIADYRIKLDHLGHIAAEQERLEHELATAKESFLTYSKKVEEARFSDALDQSRIVNVSVVEQAEVPAAPEPSKRTRTLLAGTFLSLCLGIGVAFVLDRIDPTVKSAADAAKASGLPILADISL